MSTVDLQRFCADDFDPREYLRKPIPHKGYLYATNGHVLVRVAAPEHAGALAEKPDFDAVVGKYIQAEGHAPLPPLPAGKKCKDCNGTGMVLMAECADCDGEGDFMHGTHIYECKECDGAGRFLSASGEKCECAGCYGHGIKAERIAIGQSGYDLRYLRWIAELPGARFAAGGAIDTAGHFIFDGGDGIVMPRKL